MTMDDAIQAFARRYDGESWSTGPALIALAEVVSSYADVLQPDALDALIDVGATLMDHAISARLEEPKEAARMAEAIVETLRNQR